MLRWLKNHFIPHKGNNHHPHILRTEALIFLLALAIFIEIAFLLAVFVVFPQSRFFALIIPNTLVQSANTARASNELSTLKTNPVLEQAAILKAQDMAQKGYFAHTSPAGLTPWYWLEQAGYKYTAAGENLAVNFIDSSDVHTAWMNSPSHRANIMNAGYTEIGIAAAEGIYQDHQATFVVQYFGKPRSAGIAIVRQPVRAATPTATPERSINAIPVLAKPVMPVSNVLNTVFSEPRQTTNKLLYIIGGAVLLALLLTIIIRLELPQPRIAVLPMVLILILISIVLVNQKLGLASLQIL